MNGYSIQQVNDGINWLDLKHKDHGEYADKQCADMLRAYADTLDQPQPEFDATGNPHQPEHVMPHYNDEGFANSLTAAMLPGNRITGSVSPEMVSQPEPADAVSDEDVQWLADQLDVLFSVEDAQEPAFLHDVRKILESFAARHARGVPDGWMVVYKYWDGWPLHVECQTGNQNGPQLARIEDIGKSNCTKCGKPMLAAQPTKAADQ